MSGYTINVIPAVNGWILRAWEGSDVHNGDLRNSIFYVCKSEEDLSKLIAAAVVEMKLREGKT